MKKGKEGIDLQRRAILKAGAFGAGALCLSGLLGAPGLLHTTHAQTTARGVTGKHPSPWFRSLSRKGVQCLLCPRECRIGPGERGSCRVRTNQNGTGYTLSYGNPALVQSDPVERKPFFHFLPGSRALSISTAGCPLSCSFCEVWDMALVSPEEVHTYHLPPRDVVEHARSTGVQSVSYAFGEPVAFWEYVQETSVRARRAGLHNLLHTSGYINREPLTAVMDNLDAVNVDLKSFDPEFYRNLCGGELQPVLDTLKVLGKNGVHLEITNLLIPTMNDDTAMIRRMCRWIHDELGPDVPLHLARFYPLYKLSNLPPTPVATIDRARDAAREAGLNYVYVARVTGHEGENTYCPSCGATAIKRLGFVIEEINIRDGHCSRCNGAIPGRWS
ncbi:MAG: AmmeMemoRadiSam system radical SAM enzyme [Spirochaetaceae bacterium]|nr:MAG: AmmeMemoRadiSam system radical SAM enzyme [Spirochaetaceae bacterium]